MTGLAFCLVMALQLGPAPDDIWIPRFREDRFLHRFHTGVRYLNAGNWTRADQEFLECWFGSDDDELLEAWRRSCQGGPQLDRIQRALEDGEARKAWAIWQVLWKEHGDGPLQRQLFAAFQRIGPRVLVPLATFEKDPPATERSFPANAYCTDPRHVLGGSRSLAFHRASKRGQSQVTIDADTLAQGTAIWVWYRLVHAAERHTRGYFATNVSVRETVETARGWQLYRIPLTPWRRIDDGEAVELQFHVLRVVFDPAQGPEQEIYVDEIMLEKRL